MGDGKETKALGIVVETMPGALFRVELNGGSTVLCHISRELRHSLVRLLPGDAVEVLVSPIDLTRGRIIQRSR